MNPFTESIPIPEHHLNWQLYGSGYKELGRDGNPEERATSLPAPDQLLVRIDSVGICYSDVKLINQGENHPKLKGRDLRSDPTCPGHEISFTIAAVGHELAGRFKAGERFAIQPEVVINQTKYTYGFSFSGGLTQYQLIGPELLSTDNGASILKIDPDFGYAEAALLEPWGSVLASYDIEIRRLIPKHGGRMWIIGDPGGARDLLFSAHLDHPEMILVSDISGSLGTAVKKRANNLRQEDHVKIGHYATLADEATQGHGFDDIVVIGPQSAEQIENLVSLINPGGVINLVGTRRLKNKVLLDAGRTHYDFISLVGNPGPDIAASYGPGRNRSSLKPDGTALLIGAGGPMGQMHLQYAITADPGPNHIILLDIHQDRLDYIDQHYSERAAVSGKTIECINPITGVGDGGRIAIEGLGLGDIDDVIVLASVPEVLEFAGTVISEEGMLNVFAGAPLGTILPVDISSVYLGALQITGSSGLGFRHFEKVYSLARQGKIDINASIAAVGGMAAAREAIQAAADRRFPGKIIIYPQLPQLPLTSICDLRKNYPSLGPLLGEQNNWTNEVERELMKIG